MSSSKIRQFRADSIPEAVRSLLRPLNDFADGVGEQLRDVRPRALLELEVRTANPVDNTFPLFLALPEGFTPVGALVVRKRNRTAPSALFYAEVALDWEPDPKGLAIRYVSGLDVDSVYLLTVEVLGAS